MGLGRFFDEDNIIKKEPVKPIEEIKPTAPPEPIPEEIVPIPEPKKKRIRKKKQEDTKVEATEVVEAQEVNEELETKQSNYQQVISEVEAEQTIEFPNREKDLQDLLGKVYQRPKMPVYNISRDMATGQVKVEARKNEVVEEVKQDTSKQTTMALSFSSPKKQQVRNLLDKTEQEILRVTVEIEIGVELIKMESDCKIQSLYDAKLTALQKDLDYQKKRRLILERMLQGD